MKNKFRMLCLCLTLTPALCCQQVPSQQSTPPLVSSQAYVPLFNVLRAVGTKYDAYFTVENVWDENAAAKASMNGAFLWRLCPVNLPCNYLLPEANTLDQELEA